jgi:hypothetical protein
MTHPPPSSPGENPGTLVIKDRGWVSLREFAKIANVTYMTARRWALLEIIRATPVGGQFRVYEDELRHFLQHGTRPGNPEKKAAWTQKRKEYVANYIPGMGRRRKGQNT